MVCICNIAPVAYAFINMTCRMCKCTCKRDMLRVHVLKKPDDIAGENSIYCIYFFKMTNFVRTCEGAYCIVHCLMWHAVFLLHVHM